MSKKNPKAFSRSDTDEWIDSSYGSQKETKSSFTTLGGIEVPPINTAQDINDFSEVEKARIARPISFYSRCSADDVSRASLDYAPVCRFWDS